MSQIERRDNQDASLAGQTPWQTTGPFFHYALPWPGGADLVGDDDIGARTDLFPAVHNMMSGPKPKGLTEGIVITLVGQVRDGAGRPVPDALIEIWQADGSGRYATPAEGPSPGTAFVGFGRAATSEDGVYRFKTVRPSSVQDGGRRLAPHIAVGVQGRGLIKRLVTRLYFEDAPENASDPILALVPDHRRQTLLARREGADWRFDIVLRGEDETVFFDF